MDRPNASIRTGQQKVVVGRRRLAEARNSRCETNHYESWNNSCGLWESRRSKRVLRIAGIELLVSQLNPSPHFNSPQLAESNYFWNRTNLHCSSILVCHGAT